MAVQPLSPATDRRLGRPVPHQLSNQTRAHLSAIKSLMTGSCGPVISCGISGRFQPLSPSERQVAHALLTRPPLTFIPEGNQSVRLACVRHAASVRPEPGSNSLKIVSQLKIEIESSELNRSFTLLALLAILLCSQNYC